MLRDFMHVWMKTKAKLPELGFELRPHPPSSPDLASRDFYLLSYSVMAYSEAKEKLYYNYGIEKLYERYNHVNLEGYYIK